MRWRKCFGLQYPVCLNLSRIDRRTGSTWFALSRVEICRERPEGKRELLRFSGRFKLSRVRGTEGKTAINLWRKSTDYRSILVGVSTKYELVRVRVIKIRLYWFCSVSKISVVVIKQISLINYLCWFYWLILQIFSCIPAAFRLNFYKFVQSNGPQFYHTFLSEVIQESVFLPHEMSTQNLQTRR